MTHGRRVAGPLLRLSAYRAGALPSLLLLSALLSGAIPGRGPAAAAHRPDPQATLSLPNPPGPIIVGPLGLVAAGDTLVYTIRWGAGARATSYDITRSVAATNGIWSVVGDSQAGSPSRSNVAFGTLLFPTSFSYTFPTLAHRMWIAAVPWDSATFTVSVASRNSVGVSAPVSTSWRVLRRPGVPGPIVVDSSLVVIGMLLVSPPLQVGHTACLCTFAQFQDGAVATQAGSQCARNPLWKAPSAVQQAHTDSMTFVWTSSSPGVLVQQGRAC